MIMTRIHLGRCYSPEVVDFRAYAVPRLAWIFNEAYKMTRGAPCLVSQLSGPLTRDVESDSGGIELADDSGDSAYEDLLI